MKELNLERLWSVCNTLSNKQSELCEQNIFVHLLGHRSNYGEISFEGFLNYYSFRLDGEEVIVFNNDPVSWEDFSNDDFSYIPMSLLSFAEKDLEKWIDDEIEKQLSNQKREKEQQKDNIKAQIKRLKTQLDNL